MSSSVEPVAAAAAEEDQTSNMNANTLIPPLTSPTVSNQTSCAPSSVTSSHYLLPNDSKDNKNDEDEEVTLGADKSLDISFDYLDGGPEVGFVQGHADAEARRRKRNLTTCGFGHCRPRRCWRLANAKTLLVALSSLAFLQGLIFHGFIKVFITSLERRFELSSSQSGLIASSYDLTSFPVALPLSFFGGFGNKPVYVGVAAASLGIGSFIFAIPHFATGPYQITEHVGTDLCQMGLDAPMGNSTAIDICDDLLASNPSSDHLSLFLWVFILAQFFLGCGGSILYTVGMAFLDENVSTADSPVYLAIFLAFSTLGPVIGYFASGQLLKYYVDLDTVDMADVSITPDDPRWVGAWWIGFILSGCLALLLALPIAAFPRELPGHKAIQAQRVQETRSKDEKEVENIKSIRDLPRATLYLLKNPVFDFVVLAHAMNIGVAAGVSTFVPKFVQFQFNKTASEAAFIVGCVAVPGAVGGQLLGASIVKKLKLKIPGVLKLSILFTIFSCVTTVFFFLSCPQNKVAGISTPYPGAFPDTFEVDIQSSCNEDCSCSASQFDPVCGSNGLDYFSPCHAGCVASPSNSSDQYSSCSCVFESLNASSSNASSTPLGSVTPGHCEHGACDALWGMLALTFIFLVFHFSNEPTTEYMVMRCIPESQRTFGLGIEFAIIRLFGSIPAPIIFGLVIDSTCQIWQEEDDSCAESSGGSCWFYDVSTLGVRLFLVTLLPKIVSAFFFLAALYVHKPEEAEEEKEAEEKEAEEADEEKEAKDDNNDQNKNELKTTPPAVEKAGEQAGEPEAEDQVSEQQQQQEETGESEKALAESRGEADGEEKEPMIAKDATNVGMEVIEEGEEENGEEEKPKT